ncbi:spore maturation protein [Clostridium botulinum]|uniref:nucleoside recognition domain-containing protein n=1 Tax=Clostridium botulinum TaxID=1491 RepID=UPI0007DEC84A|nr:nucleoside recognition domain-containing protein [Clostridium botulinum]KEI92810.1 spore maturation protein [Clostridium botulinum B2 433]MCC5417555.1 spore maturation protein [Clostridium botulinum]NCI21743.1 spore maturation protein [Clostridium botulinum]NCI36370.1 spore maturation protein [Clostridium botulinum]NCI73598.1 spore maturation protein [Clostridium botulinum]
MVNIIWGIIFLVGVMFGVFSGNGEQLSKSIIESTNSTVKLVIGLVGVMSLWCGIMKIAEESGLTDKIAKCIKPILKVIFKDSKNDNKALGAITMNLTANMMGLSNAATPFGIKAMKELKRLNVKEEEASNDMALFLVLNAACIQLVPTTVISIRAAMGSKNPGEIIIPAIIVTSTAALCGVIFCKILQKYF